MEKRHKRRIRKKTHVRTRRCRRPWHPRPTAHCRCRLHGAARQLYAHVLACSHDHSLACARTLACMHVRTRMRMNTRSFATQHVGHNYIGHNYIGHDYIGLI